jgi:hypothetical protein
MSVDDVERPSPRAVPETQVVHRRWLLSKRVDDGRPLIVREDRVVHPNGFASRARRTNAAKGADTKSGAPALT